MNRISVIGLGKLGLCSAVCLACEKNSVIGYDNDPQKIAMLEEQKCYIDEPGLEDKFSEALIHHKLAITSDINSAIEHSDQTFVIVPTPSDANGWFSNDMIVDVLDKISIPLRAKKDFHIINIVSTVMPGSCGRFTSYLANRTGKVPGKEFGVTYNPEFIAIGSVIYDFMNPDMVLVGGEDPVSIEIVAGVYKNICKNVKTMSLINAELAKLSINCFLTAKINFVNEMATICEATPGANIDCITTAMSQDSRIGQKLLNAGLGVGGPCLPRDLVAMSAFARQQGYSPKMIQASKDINDGVIGRILSKILCHVPSSETIDIYGSSYKSGTKLTEGSQSLVLFNNLVQMGYNTRMYDNAHDYENSNDRYPFAVVAMSDSIPVDINQIIGKSVLLIDPWRKYVEFKNLFTYYGLGVGHV